MDQSSGDMLSLIQAGLDHIDEGIAIFDEDLCLVRWNLAFPRLHGYPDRLMKAGTSVEDLIAFNAERGIYGVGDTKALIAERLGKFSERIRSSYTRVMPDGTLLEAKWYPLPEGGMVLVHRDITKQRRVEDTLRRQGEIIQGIHEAICVSDEQGLITGWNRAAESLWGYSRDEAIGKHRSLMLAKGQEYAPMEEVRAEIATHGHFESRQRFCRKNGEEFVGLLSFSLLSDGANRAERLVTFVRDISQQVKAETEAQIAHHRFETFMANSPVIAFIKDQKGRHVFANRAYEQALGPERAKWRGRTDAELWSKKAAKQFRENDANVLASGKPMVVEEHIETDDGVRTYLVSKFPIENAEGERLLGGLALDLTDIKKAEQALRESEARLRGVHENAADGIFTIDEKGIIETTNQAAEEMFGYGPGELIGKDVASLMGGDHNARHQVYIDKYIDTGRGQILGVGPRELTGLCKDGSSLAMDLAVNVMNLGDRRIFIGVIRDITERKETRQQLQQAQKMEAIGQLTGGIAHDFNNMLAVVLGNLELAIERSAEGKEIGKLLDLALEGATRGSDLTKHLLAFSRQQFLEPRLVDISATIEEMGDMLQRTISEGVAIDMQLGSDLWATKIDPVQLQSAVLNLAINGRDAMPDGGRLQITTENRTLQDGTESRQLGLDPGEYVVLTVTDNGTGIASENLEHIFEPFYTTKEIGKGSGLGLSMVYGFANQSGGKAVATSILGEGAEFKIYLPRSRETSEPVAAATRTEERTDRRCNVLLVEDDPEVRSLVAEYLVAMNIEVLQAADGEAAGVYIESHPEIDLLLTDVVLPGGISGPDISRQVRAELPNTKVLYMSGYAAHPVLQGDKIEENAKLIQKPFRRRELQKAISEILSL